MGASERAHVKVTAGRIIPALATTTAMICGLVDIEFLKIVKGLHKGENPMDNFYNANINLATGSQAMNVFRPEPSIKIKTNLEAMTEYTSWDKFDVTGEITVKELVEMIQSKFNASVKRIFPAGNDKICVFDSSEVAKQDWTIELNDGKLVATPDAVFSAWPQLRMAKQMLEKLPAGGARTNFENQVNAAAKSLQAVKDNFSSKYSGPVSKAYVDSARPSASEPEKQQYFDTVYASRSNIALQVHLLNAAGEDAELPVVRYSFK